MFYVCLASHVALVVKNPPASAGDVRDADSIPGLRRSTGEGNGNPLQYSCLENPTDRGAWWATVYRVSQSRTRLKQLAAPVCRTANYICLASQGTQIGNTSHPHHRDTCGFCFFSCVARFSGSLYQDRGESSFLTQCVFYMKNRVWPLSTCLVECPISDDVTTTCFVIYLLTDLPGKSVKSRLWMRFKKRIRIYELLARFLSRNFFFS